MKILLFVLSAFAALTVSAQHRLQGTVTDNQQNPVSYATVRLLSLPDSAFVQGVAADSTGTFRMEVKQEGQYVLSASSIGYRSWQAAVIVPHAQPLSVVLQEDANRLGAVTVEGRAFIRKEDRVIIIPSKQEVKHAWGGYELLYNLMIPGVKVDRRSGKVERLGQGVSLYIDGRKVDAREVRNLRPRDVEKIEYFEMPTGVYAGETTVINYITKQYKTGGYVALDGTQEIGYTKGDYNASVKVHHGSTSYTFFAGHRMQKGNESWTNTHEEFLLDGREIVRDTRTEDAEQKSKVSTDS